MMAYNIFIGIIGNKLKLNLGRVRKLRQEQIELNFRSRQGIFLKACRGTSKGNDAAEGEKAGQDAWR